MSIQAKLFIDDLEVNALKFYLSFSKQADANNRPTNKTVFNGISLVIELRKELNLADWAINPNQTKQLELHILPRILGGKTRKIVLYDCYLLGLKSDFSSIGTAPMTETLNISCGGFKDSNSYTEYSAYWRTTFPQQYVEPTTISNDDENVLNPKITESYYVDKNKKNIDKISNEKYVYLNILTQNMIGKKVNIDLSDINHDFIYNSEKLDQDILKNYIIESNKDIIKLEVIFNPIENRDNHA